MATFKGFAMKKLNETGWVEKEVPECGPLDAIVRPTCVSPCTSDIHTVWEGAIGDRKDMVLGHEAVGIVEEVGSLVKNIKVGDKVIVPAITPDWDDEAAQRLSFTNYRTIRRMEIFKFQRRCFWRKIPCQFS